MKLIRIVVAILLLAPLSSARAQGLVTLDQECAERPKPISLTADNCVHWVSQIRERPIFGKNVSLKYAATFFATAKSVGWSTGATGSPKLKIPSEELQKVVEVVVKDYEEGLKDLAENYQGVKRKDLEETLKTLDKIKGRFAADHVSVKSLNSLESALSKLTVDGQPAVTGLKEEFRQELLALIRKKGKALGDWQACVFKLQQVVAQGTEVVVPSLTAHGFVDGPPLPNSKAIGAKLSGPAAELALKQLREQLVVEFKNSIAEMFKPEGMSKIVKAFSEKKLKPFEVCMGSKTFLEQLRRQIAYQGQLRPGSCLRGAAALSFLSSFLMFEQEARASTKLDLYLQDGNFATMDPRTICESALRGEDPNGREKLTNHISSLNCIAEKQATYQRASSQEREKVGTSAPRQGER